MAKLLRVLLLEDSDDDALLIERQLIGGGYEPRVTRVQLEAEMRAALDAGTFDAVVADFSMPGFGALAALALLHELDVDLPFVIVSGVIGEEIAVEAMWAGAHDFVTKGKLARLVPAIEREIPAADERRARRAAEQLLRRSEARYRLLAEHATDLIRLYGPDSICRYASPASLSLLGVRPQRLVDRPLTELVHPDDRYAVRRQVRLALDTGEGRRVSYRERRGNGSYVWMEATLRPVHDVETGTLEIVSVARDLTERKREELAAKRLAAIVESCGDAVVGTTLTGTIVSWNRGAEELFGYTTREAVGQPIDILTPPDRPDDVPALYQRVAMTGACEQHEALRMHKDGGDRVVSLTISPIRERDRVVGLSTVARPLFPAGHPAGRSAVAG